MAYISEEEIDNIRKQADIVEIIGSYLPLTKKGQDYKCVCPFHDDHSPSMSISKSKQIYKCFSCGAAGNVFSFVQNYEQVSFVEAIKIIAEKIGHHISGNINYEKKEKYEKEYEIMNLACKYFQNNLSTKKGVSAKKYLLEREINDKDIDEFQIGLSLDETNSLFNLLTKKGYDTKKLSELGLVNLNDDKISDVFIGRITFPLYDKDGHVIGFSSRIYRNEDLPKYINTKETIIFKKGDNLFNYHRAKKFAKNKELIIVEGQMDAIRLYISGIKNVVALMGTALTKNQINLIKQLRCKVILCLDSDDAGSNATLKNGELLIAEDINVEVIRLSGAKDPDEYIKKYKVDAFLKNLDNPVKFFEYKVINLKEKTNLNNSEELSNYINQVITMLTKTNDSILNEITLKKLSNEYNLSYDILKNKYESLNKVENIAKEIFYSPKKIKTNLDILDKTIRKILYYMMNDSKYVELYQKKLGYFSSKDYRHLANEIVYFKEKNGKINIADFITYASKSEINDLVLQIATDDEEINDKYFYKYLEIINKKVKEEEIKKLKVELRNELDSYKKMEIAKKITEIKKEVL